MTRTEYETSVDEVLSRFIDRAAKNLREVVARLPEKTKAIEIVTFVDQDGEGFLDVQVSLDGPDLYTLNRAIADCASLFETKMAENGLEPSLPLMDSRSEEFDVGDALTDCGVNWVLKVWERAGISELHVPVSIQSHDQYGDLAPIDLN